MDVRVTSQIVKRDPGGKFRYFFDIRNSDAQPISGGVTIWLLNKQPGIVNNRDTFSATRPMQPKLVTSVYLHANTGPAQFHGDYSVEGYRYEVKVDGKTVAAGEGKLSTQFEDLS
jgi:hypothetical protein